MKKYILAGLFCCLLFSACKKEGPGGDSSLSGQVAHHGTPIPNAVVYIKYGATDLPGTQPTDFDDQTTADAQEGRYSFMGLEKGDYYLYAEGYDSTISEIVVGGIPVEVKKNGRAQEIDIPVTE